MPPKGRPPTYAELLAEIVRSQQFLSDVGSGRYRCLSAAMRFKVLRESHRLETFLRRARPRLSR